MNTCFSDDCAKLLHSELKIPVIGWSTLLEDGAATEIETNLEKYLGGVGHIFETNADFLAFELYMIIMSTITAKLREQGDPAKNVGNFGIPVIYFTDTLTGESHAAPILDSPPPKPYIDIPGAPRKSELPPEAKIFIRRLQQSLKYTLHNPPLFLKDAVQRQKLADMLNNTPPGDFNDRLIAQMATDTLLYFGDDLLLPVRGRGGGLRKKFDHAA